MSLVFCRGCGKEIHTSAPTCPHCGALQADQEKRESIWMAVVALVLGTLAFLSGFAPGPMDRDTLIGGFLFVVISIALATIQLAQKRSGRGISIAAIVFSGLGLLILAGNLV